MRINRLDLTRYGRFTDQVFDFGTAPVGKPDLHIIYGPNEAGKSTTFSALLDLLFGIEHKSSYNFLHSYGAMKIGASLQLQSGAQELTRIKARTNSLQDEAGRALPDTLLTAELGDIDRDAYRTMFSLDDDTLEQGGKAILASKGNLGELLFSASAGLAGLSQNLGKLRTQSELFYKANARSGVLADLKTKLQELEAKKAEFDARSSAQAYAKLADAHAAADNDYQQALRNHLETRGRISAIEAMLNTLPHLHRLRDLQQQLLAYADLPATPLGWAEELPKLVENDVALRTRIEAQTAAKAQLQVEIESIDPDEAALQAAGSTEQLQVLRARFLTAEKDLPEREITYRAEQQALQALMLRLGRSGSQDPQTLLINLQTETELRSLIESRSGINAAAQMIAKELQAAQDRFDAAHERLELMTGGYGSADSAGIAGLTDILARLLHDDHLAALRQAQILAREEQADLQHMLQALPYRQAGDDDDFAADLKDLAQRTLPETTLIEATGADIQKLQTRLSQAEDVLDGWHKEAVQLEAQHSVLSANNLLITEEEAQNLRRERNVAWQTHRQTLSIMTADEFEQLLTRDDHAVHSRLTQADEQARACQMRERLAVLNAQISQTEAMCKTLNTQLAAHQQQLRLWQQQIVPAYQAPLTAESLLRWIEKHGQLMQKRQSWQRACRLLSDKQQLISDAENALATALQNLGIAPVGPSLAQLLPQAQAAREQFTQLAAMQAGFDERKLELQQRQKDATAMTAQDEQWQQAWQTACQKTWLGQNAEGDQTPALDQVRESLNLTGDLAAMLERSTEMAERISKMQHDQALFRTEIEHLAQRLDLPLTTDGGHAFALLDIAGQIEQRIQAAQQQQLKLQDLNRRFEQADYSLAELTQQMAAVNSRKSEMLEHFDAENLSEAGLKIQAAKEKIRLQEACENEAQAIITALKTTTLNEAEQILEQADSHVLKGDLQDLEAQAETQDHHKQEQYRLWKQAEYSLREAENGDNDAARLEEQRRTLLLEIEDGSKQYLRLRFGITAAEQALRLYRDQHRSTMLARASDAFATISQGAYRQLTTQMDKDNEVLIAIAADGSSKTAEELSKGTRFQLYLSLRVAGYYEFVHAQRPMPFIADDIMETFDDDRSRETFQIFTQMAHQGQVIYLTHHQHLCDIAREVCPDIRMHELTPRLLA